MWASWYRRNVSTFITAALRSLAGALLIGAQRREHRGRHQSQPGRDVETLTLEQAIALALSDNPQIRNASLDVSRAGKELAASRTRRLPGFSFEMIGAQQLTPIDFTFERGVFGTFPGTGPIPAENTKLSTPLKPTAVFITRVTQPLSQLYKINLGLKQSALKGEIAREELRARRQQIARDVKRAYFALLQTQSSLEAALDRLLSLAEEGIQQLVQKQQEILGQILRT